MGQITGDALRDLLKQMKEGLDRNPKIKGIYAPVPQSDPGDEDPVTEAEEVAPQAEQDFSTHQQRVDAVVRVLEIAEANRALFGGPLNTGMNGFRLMSGTERKPAEQSVKTIPASPERAHVNIALAQKYFPALSAETIWSIVNTPAYDAVIAHAKEPLPDQSLKTIPARAFTRWGGYGWDGTSYGGR